MSTDAAQKAYLCRRFMPAEAALAARFELGVNTDDRVLSPAEIAHGAQGARVLFVSATETVDAHVIGALRPYLAAAWLLIRGLETLAAGGEPDNLLC